MNFFRRGYWQKLVLFLILFVQLIAVSALLIWLFDFAGSKGPEVVLALLGAVLIADIAFAVYIFNSPSPDIYKLSWYFIVFALPVAGILLYVFFANKQTSRSQKRKLASYRLPIQHYPSDPDIMEDVETLCPMAKPISTYLEQAGGGGVQDQTSVRFFPLVDDAFEPILEELRQARHYIFLEFFIVAPGKFWDSMLEILEEKASQGVDVRLIYDDVGSLTTAPIGYAEELSRKGIKTICHNPFRPFMDIRMNNRDHRKILVIDGHTCFSGGFNIADEYINAIVRFGHWKDNAILIKGKAVTNFTYMFLATWETISPTKEDVNKDYYLASTFINEIGGFPKTEGFVQPYGDLPYDREAVGERVYLDLINSARKYIYMVTPYLIIDKEMENAMIHAAKRGVTVKLLTPHIPDKKAVFNLTRSFYGSLIAAGVEVYEYTPGFVHEKTFICDGEMATVGTINLDYRSLYLHLECGTFLIGAPCIRDMIDDYENTIRLSHRVTMSQWKRWRDRQYWYWAVLRIAGPFL